ncbi:MAG: DUF4390 domain-containing protein [Gammaproteobacteria bacterium]
MQGHRAMHPRGAAIWLLLAGCAWLWPPAAAQAAEPYFEVRAADSRLRDAVYLLDADIDFQLSAAAQEALQNGIPLVLEVEIRVERPREWVWPDTVATLSQRYRLQYHALSDRYVVHNLNTDQRQSFAHLDQAQAALGRLRDFPLLDRRLLQADAPYQVKLRAGLVIEALPTPIRLWAYASEQWRLDSAWYIWQLHP